MALSAGTRLGPYDIQTALGAGGMGEVYNARDTRLNRIVAQYRSTNASISLYDVAADGQRFLMVKQSEQSTSVMQINVVLNWFEELKRRVPAKWVEIDERRLLIADSAARSEKFTRAGGPAEWRPKRTL